MIDLSSLDHADANEALSSNDARLKRQLLRWLIEKQAPLTKEVLDIVAGLLTDRDWEVRMTAMLTAGRLGAAQLRSTIERLPIPSGGAEGLTERDRLSLVAARELVVAQLNGKLSSDRFETAISAMPGIPMNFARAVVGMPLDRVNPDALFIHALTTPADTQVAPPDVLPTGIVQDEERYLLGDTGIEVLWVAPIPYWLGDDASMLPTPNPIRLVTPSDGFFITQYPLEALQPASPSSFAIPDTPFILRTTASAPSPSPYFKPEYLTTTFDAARQLCEGLSKLSGAKVVLPTADQWEMCARGPDGRRYPSGNGIEHNLVLQYSPWGAYHTVGVVPQWTTSTDEHGQPLVCGDPSNLRCAARVAVVPEHVAAIRPLIMADSGTLSV